MSEEEGEVYNNMSLSENVELLSRKLEHQQLRIDDLEAQVALLEAQVKVLTGKEPVTLHLSLDAASLEAARMLMQQQAGGTARRDEQRRDVVDERRDRRDVVDERRDASRGRRRSRSPPVEVRRSPDHRSWAAEQRRSGHSIDVRRQRSRSIDDVRRPSPVAEARRSRSPMHKKRHMSPNPSVHVSHLHHLNASDRTALSHALYAFFGSYGQVEDIFLADNEKWAKVTFDMADDAAKFLESHRNASDTLRCQPFVSGKGRR